MGLKIKIQGPETLAKKPGKEVWSFSLGSLKSAAGALRCGIGACEPGPGPSGLAQMQGIGSQIQGS